MAVGWVPLEDRPPEERIVMLEQRVKRLEAHASLMSVGNVRALIRQTVEPAIEPRASQSAATPFFTRDTQL